MGLFLVVFEGRGSFSLVCVVMTELLIAVTSLVTKQGLWGMWASVVMILQALEHRLNRFMQLLSGETGNVLRVYFCLFFQ